MFHGEISPKLAEGLKVLRARIDAAGIPPSKLDETLNVATWNIREFGRRPRREESIHYIAEILGQFDLIALTELRDNLGDLDRVMRILGPYWRVVFSDYSTDWGGNRERIAYLFDKRAAVFTGLAAEADAPRKKNEEGEYLPAYSWWRSPYMASFSAGNFDFVLLTVHIRWGAGEEERETPLRLLAEWVDKRRHERFGVDKDIILMGDFNIPEVDDALFRAVTSKGLRIPDAIRGMQHGSNLARSRYYDQILHYPANKKMFTNNAGVLDFYAGDHRPLYPGEEMSRREFTYQISDHLPLWVQINTWVDDVRLDQILRDATRRGRG